MSTEEFKIKLKSIEEEARKARNLLYRQFAFSNNPFNLGDIITDHIGAIKIESIRVELRFSNQLPECVYEGLELKKDMTPTKKMTRRSVWQTSILTATKNE